MGKGVITCYLLANLTRGTMPGDLEGEPVNALWVGFEDSWDEVVLPRLYAAGADVGRVYRLEVDTPGQYLDIVRDQVALADLCAQHDVRVVAFEAIVDHLAAADDHKNAEVRTGARPGRRARSLPGLFAIGTTHLNKTTQGGFRHRVAGSGAYLAVCRVALLVHRHPDDREKRVVALGKGNIGRVPDSFVFTIEGIEVPNPDDDREVADVARVGDEPYFDGSLTVDEVLAGPQPDHGSREDDVVEFLQELLTDGPKRATEVEDAAAGEAVDGHGQAPQGGRGGPLLQGGERLVVGAAVTKGITKSLNQIADPLDPLDALAGVQGDQGKGSRGSPDQDQDC